ncbi:MAG TPA: hypothetical protein VGP44_00600 [Gemmatimonadales bacterium]|nr:hypothetical protein [Gemmatimonadales bacterium]
MLKSALLVTSILLVAACGRTVATSSQTQTQLAPADAFQCVMREFDSLGFRRTMFDKEELRTSARKVNPSITISNTQFRQGLDQLDVQVSPAAAGTDLSVAASTVAEFFGQNGQSFSPLSTSAEARQAAATLAQRCGGPDSGSRAVAPAR